MDMQELKSIGQFALRYEGRDYPLNKELITIGSDQRCDIRIQNNSQVLPVHAQIMYRAGRVLIRFVGRGAAIWVNGAPVSQQELKDQDEIAIGGRDTRITLLLNKNAPAFEPSTTALYPLNRSQPLPPPIISQPLPPPVVVPTSQALSPPVVAPTSQALPPTLMFPSQSGATLELASQPGPTGAQAPQTPAPAMSSKAQETTRYLCAFGHLDEDFQDYVMRNVIYEERKALGESYGVDMSTVVSWCKEGINRIDIRDGILTGTLGLLIVIYFVMVISLIGGGLLQSSSSGGVSSFPTGLSALVPIFTLIGSLLVFIPVGIALFIGYKVEEWVKRRWPKLLPGVVTYFVILFSCITLLLAYSFIGILIVVLIWLTIFIELLVRHYGEPVNRLRKNTFNPNSKPVALDTNLERKLQESFVTGQRNVVAYRGNKPFAGAGNYVGGWSFLVDTGIGTRDPFTGKSRTPLPFTVTSLYDAIKKDMVGMGLKDVLEIEGKLYVRGQYLPEHPDFFKADMLRPTTSVDPSLVAFYEEHPIEDVRYYQCLRFNFWRGEMIFTVFLRFVKQGKELFTEVNYLLLPPMDPLCYWIDEREVTPVLSEIWKLYKRSFDSPIKLWLGAPQRLLRGFTYTRRQRKLARVAQNRPAFDYGADNSLRQYASDDDYHLFFQSIDKQMYLKFTEKQILETVCNFLEEHQIDVSEFRQRQQMILNNNTVNNNTINNNGTFNNSGFLGIIPGGPANPASVPSPQPVGPAPQP